MSEDWDEVSKDSEGLCEHSNALSELLTTVRLDSTTTCRHSDTK